MSDILTEEERKTLRDLLYKSVQRGELQHYARADRACTPDEWYFLIESTAHWLQRDITDYASQMVMGYLLRTWERLKLGDASPMMGPGGESEIFDILEDEMDRIAEEEYPINERWNAAVKESRDKQ